jgi:hypothetical protein
VPQQTTFISASALTYLFSSLFHGTFFSMALAAARQFEAADASLTCLSLACFHPSCLKEVSKGMAEVSIVNVVLPDRKVT